VIEACSCFDDCRCRDDLAWTFCQQSQPIPLRAAGRITRGVVALIVGFPMVARSVMPEQRKSGDHDVQQAQFPTVRRVLRIGEQAALTTSDRPSSQQSQGIEPTYN
jgi:hypothetical protein